MSYRKQIAIFLLFCVGALLLDWLIVIKNEIDLCSYFDCVRILFFGAPYQYLTGILLSILLSLLPLFFLKEAIYHAWRRFALWYLPVAVVLISIAPASISGGMGGPIIPTDRETVSLILSAFFLIISLLLIIYQSIMLRGK